MNSIIKKAGLLTWPIPRGGGEQGNPAALFVATAPAGGHDPSGDQPALTFIRDETQYKLADIWESGSEGLAIAER